MAWYGSLIFNFLSTFHTVFHSGYISLHYDQAFPFCHILTNQHFLLVIFLIIAILTGVRYHIADFTLHLFDDYWCWVSFHVPVGHLFLLHKNVYKIVYPFINCFCDIEWYKIFVFFGYQLCIRFIVCKYLLPFSKRSFHFVDSSLCYEKHFLFDVFPFFNFSFCFPCLRSIQDWCQKYTSWFLLEVLYFQALHLSLISFWIYFCAWRERVVQFDSFACSSPAFPAPFTEETFPIASQPHQWCQW